MIVQVEIVLQSLLIGLFAGVVGFGDGAKLHGTYIPPNFAVSSGGHDSFLNPPSNQYLPPTGTSHQTRKSNFLQPSGFSHMKHSRGQSFTSSLASSGSGYASVASGAGDNESTPPVPILKYENNNLGGGTYNFE